MCDEAHLLGRIVAVQALLSEPREILLDERVQLIDVVIALADLLVKLFVGGFERSEGKGCQEPLIR